MSTSTSALTLVATPSPSPAPTLHGSNDLAESFDCARIILAPVAERQSRRAEQSALEKRNVSSSSSSSLSAIGDGAGRRARAKSLLINIPLHGPRVVTRRKEELRSAVLEYEKVVKLHVHRQEKLQRMKEDIEEKARAVEESQYKGTVHSHHLVEVSGSDIPHRTEKRQDAIGRIEEHPGTTRAADE